MRKGLDVDVSTLTVVDTNGSNVTLTDGGATATTYNIATGGSGAIEVTQAANNLEVAGVSTTGTVTLSSLGSLDHHRYDYFRW